MDKTSPSDPIDYKSALERTGGDRDFLHELIHMFFEDFEDKRPRLEAAVETGNAELIRDLSHNLKGSAANLSLVRLQQALYVMEMTGREKDLDGARDALPRVRNEYDEMKSFFLAGSGSDSESGAGAD